MISVQSPLGFSYELRRENRKSLALCVLAGGEVVVKSPVSVSEKRIDEFLIKNQRWIDKQRQQMENLLPNARQPAPKNGEVVLLLGQPYRLELQVHWRKFCQPFLEEKRLLIGLPDPTNERRVQKILTDWYRQQAEKIFPDRLTYCLQKFPDLPPPKLRIRPLKRRWGSYSSRHEMVLNLDLIRASIPEIDYVIIHELCHSHIMAHSPAFRRLLSEKIPHWKNLHHSLEQRLLGKNSINI